MSKQEFELYTIEYFKSYVPFACILQSVTIYIVNIDPIWILMWQVYSKYTP